MIRLRPRRRDTVTADLGRGVSITFRPLDTISYQAAILEARDIAHERARAAGIIAEMGGSITDIADLSQRNTYLAMIEVLIVTACARARVISWSGVGTADGAAPAPCTPETITLLLETDPGIYEAMRRELLQRIEEIAAEGEGSPVAPAGTGAAAATIADSAESLATAAPTAGSIPTPAGDAKPT